MDRVTEYSGALVRETDGLVLQQNVMTALGWLSQGTVGLLPNNVLSGFVTVVDGFTCTPTSPASMNVWLTPGAIYAYEPLEATIWSSLPVNTTQSIIKQGLMLAADSISIAAPTTVGYSQVYLIEMQYQDLDTNPVLLPYFNVNNPAQPFSGPANSGQSQNTARLGIAAVRLKAGVAAPTGTQLTPTQDAGWTGIFTVTVAYGQTTITGGNIAIVNTAPWVPTKLPSVPPSVLNGTWVYATDTGSANAYAATVVAPGYSPSTLVSGMKVRLKVGHANTGASTFNFNSTGNYPVVRGNLAALQSGDLSAGQVVDLTFDGTNWEIVNYLGVGASPTNNYYPQVGLPYCVDSSLVANTITAPFSPAITGAQMVAGLAIAVKLANTTTGATRITVNANAAVNVIFPDGVAIGLNDLKAGMVLILIHDGTNFQVESWHNATSQLKVLELSGSGQSFPSYSTTLITCFTSVNRNTLLTSAWSGSALTIGAGEDGLWAIFAFAEFAYSGQVLPFGLSYYNVLVGRTRGSSLEFYWPVGTSVPQPGTSVTIDLQVGDTVQFFAANGLADSIHANTSPGNNPNVVMYRIEGLH